MRKEIEVGCWVKLREGSIFGVIDGAWKIYDKNSCDILALPSFYTRKLENIKKACFKFYEGGRMIVEVSIGQVAV